MADGVRREGRGQERERGKSNPKTKQRLAGEVGRRRRLVEDCPSPSSSSCERERSAIKAQSGQPMASGQKRTQGRECLESERVDFFFSGGSFWAVSWRLSGTQGESQMSRLVGGHTAGLGCWAGSVPSGLQGSEDSLEITSNVAQCRAVLLLGTGNQLSRAWLKRDSAGGRRVCAPLSTLISAGLSRLWPGWTQWGGGARC